MRQAALSYEVIHFGTDQAVWDLLLHSKNPQIQEKMQIVLHPENYYSLVDPSESDLVVKSKFRGIDPWILSDGKLMRLTELDPILSEEYRSVKKKMESGWTYTERDSHSIRN